MENKIEFNPFDKVLVRDYDDSEWRAEFYMQYIEDAKYKYLCLTTGFKQCIPFEGNEHLLGTTDSPQKYDEQEEEEKQDEEKQDEVNDNYGYDSSFFKEGDIVLVRCNVLRTWRAERFVKYKNGEYAPFEGVFSSWTECVPFDGNENLLGTDDYPERYNEIKDTLFGIKLKPGYVLEFEYGEVGVIFPIREIGSQKKEQLALIYTSGPWVQLEYIEVSKVIAIRGRAFGSLLTNGELLWKRAQKQSLTKAEIAEKYGMNVKDFEIIDEEKEEKE